MGLVNVNEHTFFGFNDHHQGDYNEKKLTHIFRINDCDRIRGQYHARTNHIKHPGFTKDHKVAKTLAIAGPADKWRKLFGISDGGVGPKKFGPE